MVYAGCSALRLSGCFLMNLRDTAEQSVTQPDRSRGASADELLPVLVVSATADQIAPPPEARFLMFEQELFVGRRPPPSPVVGQVWLAQDPLVSSQHFHIRREGESFVLRDLGSRNGTAVDGALVTTSVALR